MKKIVPILLTWDIDPSPEVRLKDKKRSLHLTRDLLDDLNVKATFYLVANTAAGLSPEISQLMRNGHEIGCHGLTHGDEEEYNRMPEKKQRDYLRRSTHILNQVTGSRIDTFRGPRVKTSHVTQGILEELGYKADCSVCSQRLDLISSNLINLGWVYAPRGTYHPSVINPYRKGSRNIFVVPVSAFIFPFISSTLYTFNLKFMKLFFKILYTESLLTGKPIVYLAHPVEFVNRISPAKKTHFNLKTARVHGLAVRRCLYEHSETKRFAMQKELCQYIKSFASAQFMQVKEYVSYLNEKQESKSRNIRKSEQLANC